MGMLAARVRRPRLVLTGVAALTVLVSTVDALAISDGNYNYSKQGCTGNSLDSDRPKHTEPHCYTVMLSLSDKTHRYVMVGVPATEDGTEPNTVELCLDVTGTAKCVRVNADGFTPLPDRPGTPINPQGGAVHVYFGADDNLDVGEHDGSEQVANGPSDGGSIQTNLDVFSVADWLTTALGSSRYLLTHPLPIADAGTGACADGICISVTTVQRVAYRSGGKGAKTRDAADYAGHEWDPPSCAGPSDTTKDCGGHTMAWWHHRNQTTYVEPGIQIYEDPDPQGSPLGPYPLPAFYVGTCGLVVGGGEAPAFPASPVTNSAGQVVVKTGC